MPPRSSGAVPTLLRGAFAARHVDAAVKHFEDAVEELQQGKWDDASAKGGRFVEAVLKALWVYVGENVPTGKNFKAGAIMDGLEQKPKGGHPDTIRLTIPRACRFAYEVASNRGARHDADEIDPSEMDAQTVVALCAWTLAEMVRFAQKGHDLATPAEIVAALMKRRYPFAEDIDGRVYADVGESAKDVALVILYYIYPRRMSRQDLISALVRHPFKKNNANVALTRIAQFIDDDGNGMIRLRNSGLRKIEELFAAHRREQ
jgi:hypothetical protein